MRITILGANSYIARNMILMLHNMILRKENIELFLYDYQEKQLDGRTKYEQIDILDMASVKQINFDVDILYIFIGKTGTTDGFLNYKTFIDINEKALLNVLTEYVDRKSCAKIIFPSTRLVYKGNSKRIYESDEKQLLTVYAVNKYACEKYLEIYCKVFGIRYIVLRICVPYATMISGVSSYGTAEFMLKKAYNGEDITVYGSGETRRTIVHIEDLCEILLRSAFSEECLNETYNVGGEDYSLLEMAKLVSKKYSVEVVHMNWPDQALKIESGSTVFASEKLDSIITYKYKHTFQSWLNSLVIS